MTALPGKPASNSVEAGSGYEKVLSVPPGERLQKARQQHKWDIAEVAEKLNLSPGVVRALEADDYRMLPNATFVKGYLRSYARELGISGDDLVRAYEALTGCDKPTKIEPIAPPMISESHSRLKYGLVALLLAGVLALVMWYWPSRGAQPPQPSAQSMITDPAARVAEEGSAAHPVDTGPAATAPMPEESVPAETAPAATGTAADEAQSSPSAEERSAVVESPLVTHEPEPVVEQPAPAEPAAAVPAGPKGKLVMTFSDDCWVEVRNSNGDLVYSSLKHAGDVVNLSVATPANVKLGDGEVVTVTFNDKPVNFSISPNRKVVRLTLGE